MHQDFRISRAKRDRDTGEIGEPRYFRHNTWVSAAVGAAGVVASLYGAKKQASAVSDANATNAQLQAQQNQSAWNAYLISRGINPAGAATGSIPTNPQAVNSKLPLWATANFKTPGAPSHWVRRGSGAPVVNTLSLTAPGAAPAVSPAASSGKQFV